MATKNKTKKKIVKKITSKSKKQIKTSLAKSPTLGTKENGALMGDQQKFEYHQQQQTAFSPTQSSQPTISYSIDATWSNPNAVPLKEDEHV